MPLFHIYYGLPDDGSDGQKLPEQFVVGIEAASEQEALDSFARGDLLIQQKPHVTWHPTVIPLKQVHGSARKV